MLDRHGWLWPLLGALAGIAVGVALALYAGSQAVLPPGVTEPDPINGAAAFAVLVSLPLSLVSMHVAELAARSLTYTQQFVIVIVPSYAVWGALLGHWLARRQSRAGQRA